MVHINVCIYLHMGNFIYLCISIHIYTYIHTHIMGKCMYIIYFVVQSLRHVWLQPHELQHARLPSLSPGVGSNPRPLIQLCYPTVSFCHHRLLLPLIFPSTHKWMEGSQYITVAVTVEHIPYLVEPYKNSMPMKKYLGLLWWSSGWESAHQCRVHGFDPRSGKIPYAEGQISLSHSCWDGVQSPCSARREGPTMREKPPLTAMRERSPRSPPWERSPCSLPFEKARAQQQRPSATKK